MKTLCANALSVLLEVKVVAVLATNGSSKMNLARPSVKSAPMAQWASIPFGRPVLEIVAVRTVFAKNLPHHLGPTLKSMRTNVLRRPSRGANAS
jgi:hypothetical protein